MQQCSLVENVVVEEIVDIVVVNLDERHEHEVGRVAVQLRIVQSGRFQRSTACSVGHSKRFGHITFRFGVVLYLAR